MIRDLNSFEIDEIKGKAKEKLGRCRKGNDIIGTQIFSILGLYARVIYYPLGENAPWGFTRISGSRNDVNLEKPFVAINSSITMDCQVFAAAHELYHIWFGEMPDYLPADLLSNREKDIDELKANRFAAEFLVDEQLLKQEIDQYEIKDFNIKSALQLAELFTVPYRTMAKRLWEIGIISDPKAEELLQETEESVRQYRTRYSVTLQKPNEKVAMDNLVDLAVSAYEKEFITFEKLEYLMELCDLKPSDVGISDPVKYSVPSDEELKAIMEE